LRVRIYRIALKPSSGTRWQPGRADVVSANQVRLQLFVLAYNLGNWNTVMAMRISGNENPLTGIGHRPRHDPENGT
jgi:hypothetical protein